MKQIIYTTIILFAFLYCQAPNVQAQVTIGSTDAPESFSTLQLDGTGGGLRLPQLDATQMTSLKATLGALLPTEQEAVAGLIVYNMATSTIDFWDGTKWASIESKISVQNGITKTNSNVELGGALTETTAINVNDKKLGFIGGKWSVNNTVFEVVGDKVTIAPSALKVYNNTLTTDASGNVKTNGNFTVTNTGNKLTIDGNTVKLEGKLRYNNANKGTEKVLTAGYTGKAYWEELRPENIRKEGTLKVDGTAISNAGSGGFLNILSDTSLRLEAGKWLVFAKVTARTTAGSRMHLWLSLRDAQDKALCVAGGDVDANGYTAPQFTFFLTVKADGDYRVGATTSNASTTLVDDGKYGTPYFYAILIDKPQTDN